MHVGIPTLAIVLACIVTGACSAPAGDPGQAAPQAAPAAGQTGPPPSELATRLPPDVVRASLPPLPLETSPRPRSDVVAAYEFAALHPEVLKYVPCFCGCERVGHQHNESCFVAARDAEGRVLEWDSHGMG